MSERFTIRVSDEMARDIRYAAKETGATPTKIIVDAIQFAIDDAKRRIVVVVHGLPQPTDASRAAANTTEILAGATKSNVRAKGDPGVDVAIPHAVPDITRNSKNFPEKGVTTTKEQAEAWENLATIEGRRAAGLAVFSPGTYHQIPADSPIYLGLDRHPNVVEEGTGPEEGLSCMGSSYPAPGVSVKDEAELLYRHVFECGAGEDPTVCHRWLDYVGSKVMCGRGESDPVHAIVQTDVNIFPKNAVVTVEKPRQEKTVKCPRCGSRTIPWGMHMRCRSCEVNW